MEKRPFQGAFFDFFPTGPTEWPEFLIICIESSIFSGYGELMKRISVLLILLAATAVRADIYKSVNDQGEVVYSDQPTPSAKRLKLPELTTYKAPPLTNFSTSSAPGTKPVASPYKDVKILEPQNDATIRNNQGVVSVQVALNPPLLTKSGHKIQYYLNGEPHGTPIASTTINFSNLGRGTYTLSAAVVDASGAVLTSATPVIFYLHRESILNPNRPNPVKPKPTPLPSKR